MAVLPRCVSGFHIKQGKIECSHHVILRPAQGGNSARSSLYPALVACAPLVLVRVEDVFDELPALHQLLISTECDGQLQWLEEVIKLKCVAAVRRRQVPPEGISLFGLPDLQGGTTLVGLLL